MTALVSFERVFEVLDLEPLVKEAPAPVELPRRPLAVDFDGVGFSYPSAARGLAGLAGDGGLR